MMLFSFWNIDCTGTCPSSLSPRVWVTLDLRLLPSPTPSIHYQGSNFKTGVRSTPCCHLQHHQFLQDDPSRFLCLFPPLLGLPINSEHPVKLGQLIMISDTQWTVFSISTSHTLFGTCLSVVNLNFKFNGVSWIFICQRPASCAPPVHS